MSRTYEDYTRRQSLQLYMQNQQATCKSGIKHDVHICVYLKTIHHAQLTYALETHCSRKAITCRIRPLVVFTIPDNFSIKPISTSKVTSDHQQSCGKDVLTCGRGIHKYCRFDQIENKGKLVVASRVLISVLNTT